MPIVIEDVDLGALAAQLADRYAGASPHGHVRALTAFRDAVAEMLECSQSEAERIVDTMVARAFLRPSADPASTTADEITWTIDPTGGARSAPR